MFTSRFDKIEPKNDVSSHLTSIPRDPPLTPSILAKPRSKFNFKPSKVASIVAEMKSSLSLSSSKPVNTESENSELSESDCSDSESICSDSDSSSSSESDSNSDSEDDNDRRIPLKQPTFNLDAFEPPNEFGVRFRTLISCDGKCENTCICSVTPQRGTKVHLALKPHQIPAIKWMVEQETNPISGVRGGLNSSCMGLGKSLEALTVIMRDYALPKPPQYPTLIIAPLSAAVNTWPEQIDTFLGVTCPYLVFRREIIGKETIDNMSIEELCKYRVIITNYETIRAIAGKHGIYDDLFELDQFGRKAGINPTSVPTNKMMTRIGDIALFNIPWTRIIADESHAFSNPKSALFYSMMCLYSERKWGLTGTPLRNYSSDLFSQFRFLGFHKVIVPKQFTLKLYCESQLDRCILYMTKEDAKIKLPELKMLTIPVVLEGKEKEMYEYFKKSTKEAHDGFLAGCVSFANVLTLFLRLRQCCISAYTITAESSRDYDEKKVTKERYTHAQQVLDRMTSGLASWVNDRDGTAGIQSSKISKAIDIIKAIPEDDKVIVFTSFKKVIDVLEYALRDRCPETTYEIVDGDVTGDERASALHRFKKGKAKVLFISYKVGAEGLNLTEATHIIPMETTWCPAVLDQASARSHRVGQEREVTVYQLVARDTIEQKMLDICQRKRELFDQFVTQKKKGDIKMNSDTLRRLIA